MSTLSREHILKMFGVDNGFKMSVWPFEIQPQTAQCLLDHDLAQRELLRQREEYIKGLRQVVPRELVDLRAQLATSQARCAQLTDEVDGLKAIQAVNFCNTCKCAVALTPTERPPA